ncbi:MAG: DUF938 domain-containing protein [Cyanobacteriota bacterium]|nr:DUF938 domain-containing protein [Cyanobacteriota bacterium]
MLFSEACERNKGPLLAVLERWLPRPARVLEVGAGTGQHAVHFTQRLRDVHWHPTDVEPNLSALQNRIRLEGAQQPAPGSRLEAASSLDVAVGPWPKRRYDAVFSANTTHIMPLPSVALLVKGATRILKEGGLLLLYGPFSDAGEHTSPSNEQFDERLRRQHPTMGVRDADWITAQAAGLNLQPIADVLMPANNRTLIFRR